MVDWLRNNYCNGGRLGNNILGRTLDELPPQTRKLLTLIYQYAQTQSKTQGVDQSDFRFSRKQLRDEFNWGDTALKVHLARLVDLDYLVAHINGHRQRHHYELFYDGSGQKGDTFLNGLIDPDKLTYDANQSGQNDKQSVNSQCVVSTRSVFGQYDKTKPQPNECEGNQDLFNEVSPEGLLALKNNERRSHA